MKSHNELAAEQGFTKFKVQVNQETHHFNTYEDFVADRWQYAPALLDVMDQDALIEEIKSELEKS